MYNSNWHIINMYKYNFIKIQSSLVKRTYGSNKYLNLIKVLYGRAYFYSSICQLIGLKFLETKYSFVFEKCLQPKNPLEAERGDG
jgi:hypothetical protein